MDSTQCEVKFLAKKSERRCRNRPDVVAQLTEYSRKPKKFCVCKSCLAEIKAQMGKNSVRIAAYLH